MTILRLSDAVSQNNNLTGGKGSSLAKMIQAGLTVPDGFVVTTEAYSLYHKTDQGSLPAELISDLQKAFDNLDTQYVAVRSSANCEDSSDNSFAGQFDSFLNTTKDNLIENIVKCWDSLHSPRCQEYLKEKDIKSESVKVAVVVQKMIQSKVSGIAFTINPVTNDTQEVMIEAGYGLGEAIVSGQITPDNYLIQKQDLILSEVNISQQTKKLVLENEQNTWLEISKDTSGKQKLSNDQIKQIAKICLQIEIYYSHPCDIEWAFANGQFFITQSRPVTTQSDSKPNSSDKDIVSSFLHFSKSHELTKQGGNLSNLFLISCIDFGSVSSFKKYYDFPFGQVVAYTNSIEGAWFFSMDSYKLCTKKTFEKINNSVYELGEYKDWCALKSKTLDEYKEYPSIKLEKLETEKLVKLLKNIQNRCLDVFNCTLFVEALDEKMISNFLTGTNSVSDKKVFLETVQTLDFESFDANINKELQLNKGNLENSYDNLAWCFCTYYFYPDKEAFVTEARKRIELSPTKANDFQKEKSQINEYYHTLNPSEKRIFDFCHEAMKIRDERKEIILKNFTLLAKIVQIILKRINVDMRLAPSSLCSDFTTELYKKKSYKDILIARKQGLLVSFDDTNSEWHFENDDISTKVDRINNILLNEHKDNIIMGSTACGGFVKGGVRVVIHNEDFDTFNEGDILVTSMTRPEFVPLMKKASAVITDEGGITCHAAIISRELGVPCIIGTKIATQVLQNGDLVEVDADNGVITILNKKIR